MSQITTHILDVSTGTPAKGVKVILYKFNENLDWVELASGVTNDDGRLSDLLKNDVKLNNGVYKINFQTGHYYYEKKTKRFYPYVEIIFELESEEHYHIPLLISPFGYTTYRGS